MRLTGDRILVRPTARSKTTASGLVIPDAYQNESETSGVVVAVGSKQPEDFTVGDTVFFSPHVGQETDAFGERMFILRGEDVLAVMDGPNAESEVEFKHISYGWNPETGQLGVINE